METILENKSILDDVCNLCGVKINEGWNYCPNCKGKIHRVKCYNCLKTVNTNWKYCPYCKKMIQSDEIVNKSVIKDSNDWVRNVLEG